MRDKMKQNRPDGQTPDKAWEETPPPDWDRMGEIADRLLSTPPDRQAAGKASQNKQKVSKLKNK